MAILGALLVKKAPEYIMSLCMIMEIYRHVEINLGILLTIGEWRMSLLSSLGTNPYSFCRRSDLVKDLPQIWLYSELKEKYFFSETAMA